MADPGRRGVADVPSFADALLALPKPFDLLLSLLGGTPSEPDIIPILSAAILTTLITAVLSASSKVSPAVKDALPKLYRYLSTASKSSEHQHQDVAIKAYVALLRTPYARSTFWEMRDETVVPLAHTLESAAGGSGSPGSSTGGIVQGGVPLQLLYHVLLVIWQLTFDETVSEEINEFVSTLLASTPANTNPGNTT